MKQTEKKQLYESYFGIVRDVLHLSFPSTDWPRIDYNFFSWSEVNNDQYVASFSNSRHHRNSLIFKLKSKKKLVIPDFVNYPSGEDSIKPSEMEESKILLSAFDLNESEVTEVKRNTPNHFLTYAMAYGTKFVQDSEDFYLISWLRMNADKKADFTFGDYMFKLMEKKE